VGQPLSLYSMGGWFQFGTQLDPGTKSTAPPAPVFWAIRRLAIF